MSGTGGATWAVATALWRRSPTTALALPRYSRCCQSLIRPTAMSPVVPPPTPAVCQWPYAMPACACWRRVFPEQHGGPLVRPTVAISSDPIGDLLWGPAEKEKAPGWRRFVETSYFLTHRRSVAYSTRFLISEEGPRDALRVFPAEFGTADPGRVWTRRWFDIRKGHLQGEASHRRQGDLPFFGPKSENRTDRHRWQIHHRQSDGRPAQDRHRSSPRASEDDGGPGNGSSQDGCPGTSEPGAAAAGGEGRRGPSERISGCGEVRIDLHGRQREAG